MVGVLIRMKWAILRHTLTDTKAPWRIVGALAGLGLAIATIGLTMPQGGLPADTIADLLALALLFWTLGWVAAPAFGGAQALTGDHFMLLPLERRRLAAGLLGAAFVAIATAVTLTAFLSLVAFAARLGPAAALVAVPGVVLQLVLVVLLSRVAAIGFGVLARGRAGAVITGTLNAAILVLTQVGWIVIVALSASGVLTAGFPAEARAWLRALPSGWALVAIEAAGSRSWWTAAAALAGLAGLCGVLLLGWARYLAHSRRTRPTIRGSSRLHPRDGLLAGPTASVLGKELRTWARDPLRIHTFAIPVAYALGIATLPLMLDSTALLPWAGPLLALMAGSCAANLYAMDGTALWLTLLTGSEPADVRGRQLAYLTLFTPVTVLVAVGCTALSGRPWAWPWVLALTPALLGGGAGIATLVSVAMLTPGADAHRRPGNPLEQNEGVGNAMLMFFAGGLPAAPAAALLWVGTRSGKEALIWAAVPVGVATGVLTAWLLGSLAIGRLRARGPELLHAMRTGHAGSKAPRSTGGREATVPADARQPIRTGLLWSAAVILLVPQGVVPMILLLIGEADTRSWFLPLHLPAPLQWPVAVALALAGCWLTWLAVRTRRPGSGARSRPTVPSGTSAPDLRDGDEHSAVPR